MALLVLFQPKIAGAIMILTIAGAMIWAAAIPIKRGSAYLFFCCWSDPDGRTGNIIRKTWTAALFFEHAYSRIAMVHDPFLDEHGAGYQMSNSYYALYNGGLFGRGLGNSITKKAICQNLKQILFFDHCRRIPD